MPSRSRLERLRLLDVDSGGALSSVPALRRGDRLGVCKIELESTAQGREPAAYAAMTSEFGVATALVASVFSVI